MQHTLFLNRHPPGWWTAQSGVSPSFCSSFIQFRKQGCSGESSPLSVFDFQFQTSLQGKSLSQFVYETWRAHHDR